MPARLPSPWPALTRAGAFGTLHGGHPGDPHLGLTVPVRTPAGVREALGALAQAGVRATLLVPPPLAGEGLEALRAATGAGHEVAGWGTPLDVSGLEVAAGQPVTAWALEEADLARAPLAFLGARGVRLLPLPSPTPEPGLTLRVAPDDLTHELPRLGALGYRPVPVRDLPGLRVATPRDLLIHLYRRVVDDRFARAHGVVPLTERADGVMRVARQPVPERLPFPPGTPAAELHIHSPRLVGLTARSALAAYRAYQRSLRDVAGALRGRPEFADARVVFAVTLLHGPLEKNGFTLVALPPLTARVYGLGFRLMRLAYGTNVAPSETEPRLAWMEREAFLRRHG
ncbi:secreted polysaccharide deacetylase [Deinococcus aerius]|uniref:Secreted polysaccharide deacetylase n=1 Tax=Deinococcus aerius TaxID=200253 RepID=A0A2I9DP37_9DEIO|nr:Sectered polysaccharide deacetylase [Deinococcus aerius]GBF03847.1 secreted polysaccharide deacetylase [Deinococcus aerius]